MLPCPLNAHTPGPAHTRQRMPVPEKRVRPRELWNSLVRATVLSAARKQPADRQMASSLASSRILMSPMPWGHSMHSPALDVALMLVVQGASPAKMRPNQPLLDRMPRRRSPLYLKSAPGSDCMVSPASSFTCSEAKALPWSLTVNVVARCWLRLAAVGQEAIGSERRRITVELVEVTRQGRREGTRCRSDLIPPTKLKHKGWDGLGS
jgi:hypothetical protein